MVDINKIVKLSEIKKCYLHRDVINMFREGSEQELLDLLDEEPGLGPKIADVDFTDEDVNCFTNSYIFYLTNYDEREATRKIAEVIRILYSKQSGIEHCDLQNRTEWPSLASGIFEDESDHQPSKVAGINGLIFYEPGFKSIKAVSTFKRQSLPSNDDGTKPLDSPSDNLFAHLCQSHIGSGGRVTLVGHIEGISCAYSKPDPTHSPTNPSDRRIFSYLVPDNTNKMLSLSKRRTRFFFARLMYGLGRISALELKDFTRVIKEPAADYTDRTGHLAVRSVSGVDLKFTWVSFLGETDETLIEQLREMLIPMEDF